MSEARIQIVQYTSVLRRWWRTAGVIVIIVLLFTALFTIMADDVYIAEATLLPQVEGGASSGVSSMVMGQLGGLGGFGLPGMATPSDIVISLLQSRTLTGWVVDSQDFVAVWGIEGSPEVARIRAIAMLQKKTSVLMNENGLIVIRVSAGDPQRVASIANAYVDELHRANVEFSTTTAAGTREFVEGRLKDTRERLSEAQNVLQEFQEQHGVLAIDAQTKATVEVIAGLQGELERIRARRDMLLEFHSGDSSEINSLNGQAKALEARISALTNGSGDGEDASSGGVLLELSRLPALTADYVRLKLVVETQGEIYALLSNEFERARIEEQRNTPTIRVLDRASPPLYPVSPRPKLNMALGLVIGSGLAFIMILLFDRFAAPETREVDRLRSLIRRDPALGQT